VNVNGDSCDQYFNIFLDPMFADTSTGDYHLTAGSPCIDVGDPASPQDPDSTIADMGVHYYQEPYLIVTPLSGATSLTPNPVDSLVIMLGPMDGIELRWAAVTTR